MAIETVTATDGTSLPLANLAQTFAYSGNNIISFTVNYTSVETGRSRNFVQTFTYTASNITNVSEWVAQ